LDVALNDLQLLAKIGKTKQKGKGLNQQPEVKQ